jgi:putative ABC transport system substrate-binding protein
MLLSRHTRRREFIGLLGAAGFATATQSISLAQQRIARIGWLVTGFPDAYRFSLGAFREGLQALGYREGQNLIIEYRWGEGKVDRLPALAKELVEQKVDVIVSGGFVGAQAAKNATREIPIVAAGVGDLVESGLVNNLARPDGNLTGFIAAAPETAAKRLQMIKEINPLARHIAVLRNPTATIHLEWKVIQRARSDLDLTFALYEANNVEELASALIAISKEHPDFIFILNDPFVFTYRKKISDAAAQAKLPAIYGFREFVDDGGLISYGPSISDTYRRAATYVDKILGGAKIGDLPVQEPTRFELVINLKASKDLGITLPPSLLARADEVIE